MAYNITHVPKCVSRKFRKKRIMGEDQYIYRRKTSFYKMASHFGKKGLYLTFQHKP